MIAAVVPVAFFTEEHVKMTRTFLARLSEDRFDIRVYHNGGPLAEQGWEMLWEFEAIDFDAEGWPFYRMWNHGVRFSFDQTDVALILNNDIEWDDGALQRLADYLEDSPTDVAIASPSPNGEPRHCFAVRPYLWEPIDERYQTWYGDVELEYLVKQAGHRLVHFDPGIRHPHIQTTMDHVPGVHDMRLADQKLFDSKWHPE